jgi:hypothetical protein
MVETAFMSNQELINAIKVIIYDVSQNRDIFAFNRAISCLSYDIKHNVSSVLYEKFITEKQCVYYESIYGDDEYYDLVINDCVIVLETIVDTLGE